MIRIEKYRGIDHSCLTLWWLGYQIVSESAAVRGSCGWFELRKGSRLTLPTPFPSPTGRSWWADLHGVGSLLVAAGWGRRKPPRGAISAQGTQLLWVPLLERGGVGRKVVPRKAALPSENQEFPGQSLAGVKCRSFALQLLFYFQTDS